MDKPKSKGNDLYYMLIGFAILLVVFILYSAGPLTERTALNLLVVVTAFFGFRISYLLSVLRR